MISRARAYSAVTPALIDLAQARSAQRSRHAGVAGLILGAAFLLSGRNLWTWVLAHGFIDTFGVVALYFGWE
jgi:hypothetical protein